MAIEKSTNRRIDSATARASPGSFEDVELEANKLNPKPLLQ